MEIEKKAVLILVAACMILVGIIIANGLGRGIGSKPNGAAKQVAPSPTPETKEMPAKKVRA